MSERNLDCGGRFRNRSVAFRMSDAEADRLNQLVAISGLTKQDYITQCLLERKVVVKPSFRIYQKVHREVFKLYDELERLESLDCADSGPFPFQPGSCLQKAAIEVLYLLFLMGLSKEWAGRNRESIWSVVLISSAVTMLMRQQSATPNNISTISFPEHIKKVIPLITSKAELR